MAASAVLLAGAVLAQVSGTFSWDLPTERTDGTVLQNAEIIRTDIICNGVVVAQALGTDTTATATLAAGEQNCSGFVFAVEYEDGTGELSSGPSNIVMIQVPVKFSPPRPADNLLFSL